MPDDEPQTALLLTEQEWNDLEAMVRDYKSGGPCAADCGICDRRWNLADRIIDANS